MRRERNKHISAVSAFSVMLLTALILLGAVGLELANPVAVAAPVATTTELPTVLTQAAAQAALAVRAYVIQSQSHWNEEKTLIETDHTLAVRYVLWGKAPATLVVRTSGGFLPNEGIGLRTSHTAYLNPGEEAFLFLQQTGAVYTIAGGDGGKYTVLDRQVIGEHAQQSSDLSDFIVGLQQVATRSGRSLRAPANWQAQEPDPRRTAQMALPNILLVDPKWPGEHPKLAAQFNNNSQAADGAGGTAEQFLAAVKSALRTWSMVGDADYTLTYGGSTDAVATGYDGSNEIVFMHKGANSQVGQAQIWFTSSGTILEADIWLNDDYQFDATGAPSADEIDLESAVLHEMGHWLPLMHLSNPDSVMYSVLAKSTVKRVLHADDIAAMEALYPCVATPCIDAEYADAATPTATASASPSVTPTVTPTATPTIIPTVDDSGILTPTSVTPATSTPAPILETKSYLPVVINN